jgi:dihydropteroate synthase
MEADGMARTNATRTLRCGERTLAFGRIPLVMGILNVTPDSFSDGGRYADLPAAIEHAHAMARDGADIIDVGGESTRPGSEGVAVEEELDRVMPVIDALLSGTSDHDPVPTPVSIDTRKPHVAREALRRGVHMVNDVTGGSDPGMADALRDAGDSIPIVLMHMKGEPRSMQEGPWYDDVVAEVGAFLRDRAASLEASGVAGARIVVDPGIGFGKRVSDNLDLLKNIDALRSLGYPVLIGASRKSFIGSILNRDADERLCGSLAVAAQCYDSGVEMVRVHDVRETVEMFRVIDAIRHPDPYRSAPAG